MDGSHTLHSPTTRPTAPQGLSFGSHQPPATLFNFPSSSNTVNPVPLAPAAPSPERSTRSSAAQQAAAAATAVAELRDEEGLNKAERRAAREERRQVKAERRARTDQPTEYQDTARQQELMQRLLSQLVDQPADAPPPAQAPPTPTPTSPSHSAVPSFIAEDPLSSDPDSSSDDDAYGQPKPPRPPRYDSHGLLRPRPSYYYDAEFDPATGGAKKRGRRGGLKGIPVFEPTIKEFEGEGGFYGYVKRIEKYGMRSGVVKVIPPKEWTDALPSTSAPLRDIRLREPIEQHILGSQGLYRVTNVAKTRIWNPAQWKDMADSKKWEAPDFKAEAKKGDRSERPVGKRGRAKKDEEDEEEKDDEVADEEEEERSTPRPSPRGRVKLGRGGGRATSGLRAGFLSKGKGKGKSKEEEESEDDAEEEHVDDPAVEVDAQPMQQATPPDTSGEGDVEMVDAPANPDEPIASTSKSSIPVPDSMPLPHPSHMRPVLADIDTDSPAASVEGSPAPKSPSMSKAKKEKVATPAEPITPRLTRAQIAAAAAAEAAKPKPKGKGGKGKGKATTKAAGSAAPSPATTPKASGPRPKRPSNLQRAEPTDAEWSAFMDKYGELPHDMKREEYTVEMMRDVERRYWRTLTFGEAPMYGADMNGSIFSDETKAWNVAHLGDLLPRLAPPTCQIPGVVSPYLYFGMWRATFAWHVEDADLYSINYIHFGAPKFWYSVPQEQSERFERVMEGFFPTDRSKCSQFLRHKAFLASPRILANSGITLNRVAQLPGEFILTYPKGYHSGFNLGFNCAESINFATERWLPLGKVAKSCYCIGDSVNIDVDVWLHEAAKAEAEARGEVFPPPGALPPTPPPGPGPRSLTYGHPSAAVAAAPGHAPQKRRRQSEPQQQLAPAPRPGWDYVPVIPGGDKEDRPLPSRRKSKSSYARPSMEGVVAGEDGQPLHPLQQAPRPQKKARLDPQAPAFQQQYPSVMSSKATTGLAFAPAAKVQFVCALCPDMSGDGLVRVGEPGVKHKKDLSAHRVCVMFTPATWIEVDPTTQEEIVRGYAGIEKARWKLKCQLCSEPHGTKVQCTKGKCTKAVHVTCAMHVDSGFFLDATVPGDEGHASVSLLDQARAEMDPASPKKGKVAIPQRTSPTMGVAPLPAPAPAEDDESIKLTVLCRTHNPDFKLQEAARKAQELKERVEALKPNARIRVRTPGGVFEVAFVQSFPAKESVAVAYDDGVRFETKWKNIAWDDATADAKKEKERAAVERARAAESVYVYETPSIAPSAKRARTSYPPPPPMGSYAYPPPPPGAYYAPPHQQQGTFAAFPPYPMPPHQHPQAGPPMAYTSPPHAQAPLYSYPPPPPGYYMPPPQQPHAGHAPNPYPGYPPAPMAHQQQRGYGGPPPPPQGSWNGHPGARQSPYAPPHLSPYGPPPPHLAPSPSIGYQPMPPYYQHPQHAPTPPAPHHHSPHYQQQQHLAPAPSPRPSPREQPRGPPLQPIPSPRLQHQQYQQRPPSHSPGPNRSPSFANILSDGGEGRFPHPPPQPQAEARRAEAEQGRSPGHPSKMSMQTAVARLCESAWQHQQGA